MGKLHQERLNEIGYNKKNEKMIIIEYKDANHITVQFENGLTAKATYQNFKEGGIKNPINRDNEKVGKINYNKYESKMTVIKDLGNGDVLLKFENGYTTTAKYFDFKRGLIKNPYDKTVYGIGYVGEGIYKTCENYKINIAYRTWQDMLRRCYNPKYQEKYPTYKECSVCKEWHNFQVFAKWFDENYYKIENKCMNLDKDILVKGNKIYSPDTCIFVSTNINNLFVKSNCSRGKYPIGVYKDNYHTGRYIAQYANGKGKVYHLGYFSTPEEAFYLGYKPYKEKLIKEIADKYKDKYSQFPRNLYDAMYRYEVEITD